MKYLSIPIILLLFTSSFADVKNDTLSLLPVTPKPDSTVSEQPPSEPFAWGDFTWLNGNDRRHSALLDSKYFTGSVLLDANYTISNQHPIDHTVVGSTALSRDNEFTLSFLGLGGDFHYDNVHARVMLQYGTRATGVPRNDASVTHGQFDLANAYRYFSEANAGYHFDVWHGLNVDAGIFMSYIGLFSYYAAENWAYQQSFTSDNTPWFFNGLRIQVFPSDRLKIELWLVNGWQAYAKFNNGPGIGFQAMWRPDEWISLVSNNYYGTDTPDKPDRIRVHTDNSIQIRYLNQPGSYFHRAAFSVTGDLGYEKGDGVSGLSGGDEGPKQFFNSWMIYHRLWMANDHIGWTFGGGYINNPGRYLVLLPTGNGGASPFTTNPGDQFHGWDISTTLDWMPKENITWRAEIVSRHSDVDYFAGPGGVTSPDGYTTTPLPADWKPSLVKSESRFIGALLVRF
jgi:hypothetical protein